MKLKSLFLKPWRYLPVTWGHALAPYFIRGRSRLGKTPPGWESLHWKGLSFPNRLSVAGGFDKSGQLWEACTRLGFGFHEVGTITPLPQAPNPGRIMGRNWEQQTLWNKMGFPSPGREQVFQNLSQQKSKLPLFINIGKNRQTANDNAVQDYLNLIQYFESLADVFVVNISSPNTQGLRQLQEAKFLTPLMKALRQATQKPMLYKLSPDMSITDLLYVLDLIIEHQGDGVILTNTTTDRPETYDQSSGSVTPWPQEGGLSGAFLKPKAEFMLQQACQHLRGRQSDLLVVSAGGIASPQDIAFRLACGAHLVQVYSHFVFDGFSLLQDVSDYFNKGKHSI